ncbi:hypothetical protein RBB79_05710 [Tunturiibacter empetritectus]|uniref:Uncharacterized protein n=2 Tax=Tunturiibacter TaxID=3154218 RepID=A0A852VHM0_9BACT|nr:hypothetical protein [Edaphobacter lichenicola]NYF89022.1 hypothetical protein [Edaphobacter lichenicola]
MTCMGADVGAIGSSAGIEALAAAGAANWAQSQVVEEPVPASAVGAMQGFGVAVGAESSVGELRL